jgi:hypothetical protein
MGFNLYTAIARVDDDREAERMLATARELAATTPVLATMRARRFGEPFAGVIVGFDHLDQLQKVLEDDALADAILGAFDPLVAAFPNHAFAIVEVDCFGGTCRYHGRVLRGGEQLAYVASAHDGHQQLFRHLGVADPPWFFAGFTRGYLDSGEEPPGPRRREVLCHARATLADVTIAGATLDAMQLAGWRITIATERTLILDADDVWLSLNDVDGTIQLDASSHVDPERTRTLLVALLDELGAEGELAITSTSSRDA